MLLEQIAPADARGRTDRRFLAAPQPAVFAAIQQVCPAELRGVAPLVRWTPFEPQRPLYAQMLGAGYTVLGTLPLREVVIGRVGRLTHPFAAEPRVRDKRAFLEFDAPRHIKILIGFALRAEEREGVKGTDVGANLRLWSAGAAGSGALHAAWPLVGAVGGAISRAFLAALAERVGA